MNKTNKKLVLLISKYRPFLVFGIKAESIYPETVEEIKKGGAKTVCLFEDPIDLWPIISRLAPAYDYFFSVDRVVLRRLRRELGLKNCFYMALATESMADPFANRQDKYDISFIGTYNNNLYSKREKYLTAIKDLGLNIWGTSGWSKTPLAKYFHGRSLGNQRLDIYSQSKIVVDINWDLMPAEFLSIRTFEAMGCGAMFMTDYAGKERKKIYVEGREIVLFKDENELREKVIYYLKHDKEREDIARAAYTKTAAKHTYIERVKQLLNTIENPSVTF